MAEWRLIRKDGSTAGSIDLPDSVFAAADEFYDRLERGEVDESEFIPADDLIRQMRERFPRRGVTCRVRGEGGKP